jgi:hypothetical protein
VGAVAALPIISMLNDTSGLAQKDGRAKATASPEEVRNTHDTPPPVVIGNGSFLVEKEKDYLLGEIITSGNKKQHHINPQGPGKKKIFPAHIKVIDGSGELLYRNDRAKNCVITFAVNEGSSTILVTAAASPIVQDKQTFIIETDDNKELEKQTEKPTAKKRQVRYKLKDGTKDFSIVDVKIVEGTDVLYKVTLATLASMGDDFKVMIWLEEGA